MCVCVGGGGRGGLCGGGVHVNTSIRNATEVTEPKGLAQKNLSHGRGCFMGHGWGTAL